ncbi:MAG TPA: biopolymer transporter ExbD [Armatimonadaceae bacterium]|nr:biopolymer transporter ExbD [Armatimonadaceae bacterium]
MALRNRREMKKTKIEIIPMVDVMLFLLVFFILSTVGIIKLEGLNVNLPKASTGGATQASELTVSINNASEIMVNNRKLGPNDNVGQALLNAAGTGANPADLPIVISADRGVSHGLVVRCIDEARSANFSKFAIATTRAEDEEQTEPVPVASPVAP